MHAPLMPLGLPHAQSARCRWIVSCDRGGSSRNPSGQCGRRTRMVEISCKMSTACCAAARLSVSGMVGARFSFALRSSLDDEACVGRRDAGEDRKVECYTTPPPRHSLGLAPV
ncbi:hypothetical protein IF1G_09798 [Cordyceps javanica]|uniref:Uncharacterized protein n=1 Tax=Cordyceps javanica TaxID=43265 RepID=A0A545UQJ0_9HYPO|nr:hypothetical protein IF1G_09798 [Cordyceps javanica]